MPTHEDFAGPNGHRRGVAPIRLLLVDDHRLLRDALAIRLSGVAGLTVVGGTATADPALTDKIVALRPDVVTVEVAQIGPDPADLLGGIVAAAGGGHVVALTDTADTALAVTSARVGVVAWVPKGSSVDHLVDVLRGAHLGQADFPPAHLGEVLRALRTDVRRAQDRSGPLDLLSQRELEVLASMVEGKRRAEIARELSVSTNTVRTHTHKILTKLGAGSSLEAVRIAVSAGMRPPKA
jgi:DNA-binding NarL/FixJ family response regulator